jgi:hypothetical protein
VLLAWVASVACVEPPQINQEDIVFTSGTTIRYHPADKTSNPSTRSGRVVVETPRILARPRRLVLIREESFAEGGAVQLVFFDYCGRRLGYSERALINAPAKDTIFFLEEARRIFIGQSSSHFTGADKSFLLDEDGRLIKSLRHRESVGSFGHSADGRLIWIIAMSNPETGEVTAFASSDGKVVAKRTYSKAGTIQITYAGRTYEIRGEMYNLP